MIEIRITRRWGETERKEKGRGKAAKNKYCDVLSPRNLKRIALRVCDLGHVPSTKQYLGDQASACQSTPLDGYCKETLRVTTSSGFAQNFPGCLESQGSSLVPSKGDE